MILADRILSIKVGNRTLKELIELQKKGKLRVECENQELPESPYNHYCILSEYIERGRGYSECQQDMLKEGWVKCEEKEEHG
jgi:hypothetical protein